MNLKMILGRLQNSCLKYSFTPKNWNTSHEETLLMVIAPSTKDKLVLTADQSVLSNCLLQERSTIISCCCRLSLVSQAGKNSFSCQNQNVLVKVTLHVSKPCIVWNILPILYYHSFLENFQPTEVCQGNIMHNPLKRPWMCLPFESTGLIYLRLTNLLVLEKHL